jgi:hypothetical protein
MICFIHSRKINSEVSGPESVGAIAPIRSSQSSAVEMSHQEIPQQCWRSAQAQLRARPPSLPPQHYFHVPVVFNSNNLIT